MLTAISIEREAGSKALVRVGDEPSSWGVGHGYTCVRAAGPEPECGQLVPSWACSLLDCAEGPHEVFMQKVELHLLRATLPYAPRMTGTYAGSPGPPRGVPEKSECPVKA